MIALVEKRLVAFWKMRLFESHDGSGVLFPLGPLFGFVIVDRRIGKVVLRKLASHSAITTLLGAFALWVGWQLGAGPVGTAVIAVYDLCHGLLGIWRIVHRLPRLPVGLAVEAYVMSRGESSFVYQTNQAFLLGIMLLAMTPILFGLRIPVAIQAGYVVCALWSTWVLGQLCVARWLWRRQRVHVEN
jgi:hypothetical protein